MKENTKNARINVRSITFTAVMAALVFVFTYTFKIPFVNGYTHIGDSMIFLAIVFLGYKKAPLAAGIGAGEIERFVVLSDRFMKKVESK